MTEAKADQRGSKALHDLIQNEIRSDTNRRFLNRMPVFRPEAGIPPVLRALLNEIDRAETGARAAARARR